MAGGPPRTGSGWRRKAPVVLVVAADPEAWELTKSYLRYVGFAVELCGDEARALAIAARTRPTVVVVDEAVADEGGWALAHKVKSEPSTRGVPVLALCWSGGAAGDRAREAECDAIVEKPFTPEHLVASVLHVVSNRLRGSAADG